MNCEQARTAIGAEPRGSSAALEQHLAGCPDCSGYRREMLALETQLERALALPARADASARVVPLVAATAPQATPARRSWRGWALAASLVLAGLLGLLFTADRQDSALVADLVVHMGHEPESWVATRPVPQSALDLSLRRARLKVDGSALGEVVYLQHCWFRGRWVPHLVLRTAEGPVTVMLLPDETVDAVQRFDDGGYAGVIAPAPVGAIAVLGRGGVDVEAPLARVQRALRL